MANEWEKEEPRTSSQWDTHHTSKLLVETHPLNSQKLLQSTNFLKVGHTPKYDTEMCQKRDKFASSSLGYLEASADSASNDEINGRKKDAHTHVQTEVT